MSYLFPLRRVAIAGLIGLFALIVLVRMSNPSDPAQPSSKDRLSHAQELSLDVATETNPFDKAVASATELSVAQVAAPGDGPPVLSTTAGVFPPAAVSLPSVGGTVPTPVSPPPPPNAPDGLQLANVTVLPPSSPEVRPAAASWVIPPAPTASVPPSQPVVPPPSFSNAVPKVDFPPPTGMSTDAAPLQVKENLDSKSLEDLVANLNALKAKRAEMDKLERELTVSIREKIAERKRTVQQLERDLEKLGIGAEGEQSKEKPDIDPGISRK